MIAAETGASVFEVFNEDAEIVIDVFNHLIARKMNEQPAQKPNAAPASELDFWDYV